jgi:subtilisin family serine protease
MKRQMPWIDLEDARRALVEGDGNGVRIAIIDSGVEMSHPNLAHLVLAHDIQISDSGVQAEVKSGNGTDVFGHGTAVASIINKLAPKASLGSFQVLGEQLRSRTILIREGVRQAIDAGYDILNCSFGCGVKEQVLLYKDWIDEAYLKGIHIVAACNNIDFRRPEWPGFFPSVITVNMAKVSSEHEFFRVPGNLVEFAAGGVDVEVAWRAKQMRRVSGSSFAAPRLAALLARLLSMFGTLHPLEAKALLLNLAKDWRPELRASNVVYDSCAASR